MASESNEVAIEFPSAFRIYKDGRVDRLIATENIPAGVDPNTNVESKDISITQDNSISARIFRPKDTTSNAKLPLLIYVHGGAFVIGSPFALSYHAHINAIAAKANAVAVSVHYRRAPEHPLPVAYEDSWDAFKWVASHAGGSGPEQWLNEHVDFGRVFLGGDSAGANLAHYVAVKAGVEKPEGLKLEGLLAIHPYFMKDEPDKLIEFLFPTGKGLEDPRLNPGADPNVKSIGSKRVSIFVAEKDSLKNRGEWYYEVLKNSGWDGDLKIVETKEEGHCFHLFNPTSDKAADLLNKFVEFIK